MIARRSSGPTVSLAQRRHQALHTLMLAHGDGAFALRGSGTHRFTCSEAEETQRLPAASQVVRKETRDDPTLKSTGTPSLSWAGNPKRPLLNCRSTTPRSRGGGHTSCDGTADYLLRDCGSVGHRHRATTCSTNPKRERERGVGFLS